MRSDPNARTKVDLWKGEEGYSCISIITCPCINYFDMVWHCWLFAYVLHSSMFLLLLFFFMLCLFCSFWSIFTCFLSKIQKHIKSRKSKKFDRHYCVLSHPCLALYLRTYGYVHLRVLLFLYALVSLWEKSWHLCDCCK